jgi:hypothetical protein
MLVGLGGPWVNFAIVGSVAVVYGVATMKVAACLGPGSANHPLSESTYEVETTDREGHKSS